MLSSSLLLFLLLFLLTYKKINQPNNATTLSNPSSPLVELGILPRHGARWKKTKNSIRGLVGTLDGTRNVPENVIIDFAG